MSRRRISEGRMRIVGMLALATCLGALGCPAHEHDHGHGAEGHGAHHGGEEAAHGAQGEGEEAQGGGGSITRWTGESELFLEHPALLAGEPAELLVHWTRLADFAPVRSGRLTLRFEPAQGGEPVEVVAEEPVAPGIYAPTVELPRAGGWDLRLALEGPELRDRFEVSGLRVYADHDEIPAPEPEPSGGVAFLKEQQWRTGGFATAFAEAGTLPAEIEAPGEIVPAASHYAEVSAPVDGLVDPAGSSAAPAPGQAVEQGQTLAVLAPALGDSGSSVAAARAELRKAETDYARAKRLLAVEAVPERRVEEARIRLDAARETLASLREAGAGSAEGRVAVRAPIAGIVIRRELSAGRRVEAGSLLFAIVDPSTVWLRVHVPIDAAPRIRPEAGASFALEGGDALRETTRLVSVGAAVEGRSRSVPVLFELESPEGSIPIGAHARVRVRTGERVEGVLVPDAALLSEDGHPIAYVQTSGERFERRMLELGPRAEGRVLVRAGIEPGERVVSGAAYHVRLASFSGEAPAHGHGH